MGKPQTSRKSKYYSKRGATFTEGRDSLGLGNAPVSLLLGPGLDELKTFYLLLHREYNFLQLLGMP